MARPVIGSVALPVSHDHTLMNFQSKSVLCLRFVSAFQLLLLLLLLLSVRSFFLSFFLSLPCACISRERERSYY